MATGCSLSAFQLTCDYTSWVPPLSDTDIGTSPGQVIVNNVNGVIPSNAFQDLNNTGGFSGTPQLSLDCGFGAGNTMSLLSDSLTNNLAWVEEMLVSDCNEMDIADGALSAMTGVTLLTIIAGNFSSISATAFSGLANLDTLYLYAGFPTSGIPAGLFDGLVGLTNLDMSRTTLHSLPSGLFKDMHNLTDLSLLDTGLTTLSDGMFLPLFSLSTLDLTENAWICDCDLQWLGDFLINTGLTSTTCGTPADLAGYDVTRALASLTCTATTTVSASTEESIWWRYGVIGGSGLALLVAIIAVASCCYQRQKLNLALKSISGGPKNSPPAYSNPTFKSDYQNTGKQAQFSTISEQSRQQSTNHHTDSPFNKRSRRVTPSKAWGQQAVDDW